MAHRTGPADLFRRVAGRIRLRLVRTAWIAVDAGSTSAVGVLYEDVRASGRSGDYWPSDSCRHASGRGKRRACRRFCKIAKAILRFEKKKFADTESVSAGTDTR